jgi:predicted MFS family arabinose efflux permease
VLADALSGEAHPDRVLAAAVVLPLLGAAVAYRAHRPPAPPAPEEPHDVRELVRATLRPGLGLMLVNFGYVALLSFGTLAVAGRGLGGAQLVVPAFALTVIAARTAGGSIPDRAGPRRTLMVSTLTAAIGLLGVAYGTPGAVALAAVVVLAAGQALAVPSLGLLALARVPAARHGAAAGLFFSFFDAGVGLGGPAAGLLARATSASGTLAGAAAAVALAAPIALVSHLLEPSRPLVD